MKNDFLIYRTNHEVLSRITDFFFYIDSPIERLLSKQEDIIPYPRATFGYFFNHPFLVTNQHTNESVNLILTKVSHNGVTVQPTSKRVKIVGVHLQPYILGYLTNQSAIRLPHIIQAKDLLGDNIASFTQKMESCTHVEEKFRAMEAFILKNLLQKDLTLITKIVQLIEQQSGDVKVDEIAHRLEVSSRTIRNHFYHYVGCSPKTYIELVKLKKAVYQLNFSEHSLTNISYDSNYFDQSHFIKSLKKFTGKSPKEIQKESGSFRLLQF
ncbi:MAG TPA: hypothetical protein DCS93_08355 [Microscillaceae bacterium]|nr:hypothetical protein [Microscillaceae bacterium]